MIHVLFMTMKENGKCKKLEGKKVVGSH
jgi:hypothetical protein